MKGHGEKLSRKQEQAIAALLTCSTLQEAAKAVEISESTLWRWLQNEEFKEAYMAARRESVSQAIAKLQQASSKAVETLEIIMQNETSPASSRVTAAKTVLEMSMKAIELEDLATRVEALENSVGS